MEMVNRRCSSTCTDVVDMQATDCAGIDNKESCPMGECHQGNIQIDLVYRGKLSKNIDRWISPIGEIFLLLFLNRFHL